MSSPSRLNLRTTPHIIKQSFFSFLTSPYIFLFLSLLLFSFRTAVENGTIILTSFLDREPSVQTLFSRFSDTRPNLSGTNPHPPESLRFPAPVNRRHRPFLHIRRTGILGDDFFSKNEDDISHLRGRLPNNGSSVNLSQFFHHDAKIGFSGLEPVRDFRILEISSSGSLFFLDDSADQRNETAAIDKAANNWSSDIPIFGHGINLDGRDAATLFFLVSFLSAAYSWVILGFLFSYCCVLGIVFFAIVNSHLGKHVSAFETFWSGPRLGMQRLPGFVLLRWAVRDALTQILGLWFFSDIEDQVSFFKLFVKLKLMPFSIASPWMRDTSFEADASGFLLAWVLLDTFVDFVFAIDCWVAIMDTNRSGQEIVKEGCYLMSTMVNQAVQIKCLELVFCRSFMRLFFARVGGRVLVSFLESVAEVYFMVVWLVFYFATRYKDAELEGRSFGQRDLEDSINGRR